MASERGYSCVLSLAGSALGEAIDITVDIEHEEQDITRRANAGAKGRQPGLSGLTISGDALLARTVTAVASLISAFTNKTRIAYSAVDENGGGWSGSGYLFKLTENQRLADAVKFSFELRSDGVITYTASSTTAGT